MTTNSKTIIESITVSKEEIGFICKLWETAKAIAEEVAGGGTQQVFEEIVDDIYCSCFDDKDYTTISTEKYYDKTKYIFLNGKTR